MQIWHYNTQLKSLVLQVHTPTVVKHLIENLGFQFEPNKYLDQIRKYTYMKPQNKE